ncbi:histidine phosphatase family protein [Lysinibacillus sp. ZYM-1]|uniref:histidine phosphatase family protein n=1 Tax=Lysinibacillus sp. ZYM-1 TaxID=1681184 RepID=UPI0006CE79B5|nr:histidine phosphatase family protein [Lysinibacillus sp. ZYM-1]KPN95919.1 phosphoglycerate mutase [Lysinibacillus sp. ZYM-1]
MSKIYIIRHCLAEGQSPDAPLTQTGMKQAESLADFFKDITIHRILSSPFLRAVQSIESVSERKDIKVEIDKRLSERLLSTKDLPDWYEKLQATFLDMSLKFDGGESSKDAMERIVSVVEEVFARNVENTLIVSHGNIIALLLKHYNNDIDFQCWQKLSNPDVFLLQVEHNKVMIERVWRP